MNIDERLEFLVQSTESLHASTQELHATVAALIEVADHNERRWLRIMRVLRDALDAGLSDNGDEGEAK